MDHAALAKHWQARTQPRSAVEIAATAAENAALELGLQDLQREAEGPLFSRLYGIVGRVANAVKETEGWRGHAVCTCAGGLLSG